MKFDNNFSKLAIGARGDIIFMSLALKELNRVSGHFKPILSLDFNFDNSHVWLNFILSNYLN